MKADASLDLQAKKLIAALLLVLYSSGWVRGQTGEQEAEREFGVTPLIGLNKPDHIRPVSAQTPVGFEFRYSRLYTDQSSWEQCQCFYRSGFLLNAYTFRNPVALGKSVGAALFFEPILVQSARWGLSLRALAGITYVSRQYDPIYNPGSSAFGTALNGLIGASFITRYNITPTWRLLVGLDYKHISNAGIRLPNQGLNIPALSVGLVHHTGIVTRLPNLRQRPASTAYKRWMARALAFGSVKVMEATTANPQQGYPIFGFDLLAGYHLTRTHVLSGGLEWLDDRYFKEQIRRWTGRHESYQQGTLLAGYEFWQGHFVFTAHWGWNLIRPRSYQPDTYQKYGLLYRLTNGLTGGVAVKAYGENTKNIHLLLGMTF